MLPMVSIVIPRNNNDAALNVVTNWNSVEMQRVTQETLCKINERIRNGEAFLYKGEKHYVQHPLSSIVIEAIEHVTAEELKSALGRVVVARPENPDTLVELFGE